MSGDIAAERIEVAALAIHRHRYRDMIRQDDKPNSFEREWAGIALAAADAVSPQPEYEQRLRELFIEVMEQTHDDAMAAAETASDDWREGAEWFGATLAMYWGQKMRSEDV